MLKLSVLGTFVQSINIGSRYFQEVPEDYAFHVEQLYNDIHKDLVSDEEDIDPLYEGLQNTDVDVLIGEWDGLLENDL